MDTAQRVAFAWAGVGMQDALLQSARRVHATIAAGLLAAGAVSFAVALLGPRGSALLAFGALVVEAIAAARVSVVLIGVSRARSRDVIWWQRDLVRLERSLPADERAFTRFKAGQDAMPDLVRAALSPEGVGDADLERFIPSDGKTKLIYDVGLPRLVLAVWLVLLLAAAARILPVA